MQLPSVAQVCSKVCIVVCIVVCSMVQLGTVVYQGISWTRKFMFYIDHGLIHHLEEILVQNNGKLV